MHRHQRTFWSRVEEILLENGEKPSLTAVADMIGIKQPSVSEWKKPGGYPTIENGVKLAQKIRACVEWLYTERGPKRPTPADMAAQRLWTLWDRLEDIDKGEVVGVAMARAKPPGQAPQNSKSA